MARATIEHSIEFLGIELPVSEKPEDKSLYHSRQVNGRLSPRQAGMLARLCQGLMFSGAQTDRGEPVITQIDAIRFVLEALCDCEEAQQERPQPEAEPEISREPVEELEEQPAGESDEEFETVPAEAPQHPQSAPNQRRNRRRR